MKESIVYWAGHHQVTTDWHWLDRKQPHLCIWHLKQGDAKARVRGRELELKEDDFFVCRMDEVEKLIQASREELHVTVCVFHAPWAPLLPLLPRVKDGSFLESCLRRLVQTFLVHGGRTDASSRWLEALLQLLIDDNPEAVPPADDILVRIRQLCQAIDADPSAAWKVDELAKQCDWSVSHFHRQFKQIVGMAPREYISQSRMSAAQSLLREGEKSVAAISEELGYSDVAYFSKHFRELTQCSPSEYRNRCRKVYAGRTLLKTTTKTLDEIALQIGFEKVELFNRYFTEIVGTHPDTYRELYRTGEIV
ncbi:MAG: AraC family transcriptional regulator [Planctomycetes bacterium]|nr:AraC family transcriptional regulator [Planctomycetota bacterium]